MDVGITFQIRTSDECNSHDESAVKSDICFFQVASFLDHLVDEGENAEECDRFDHASQAKDEDL